MNMLSKLQDMVNDSGDEVEAAAPSSIDAPAKSSNWAAGISQLAATASAGIQEGIQSAAAAANAASTANAKENVGDR